MDLAMEFPSEEVHQHLDVDVGRKNSFVKNNITRDIDMPRGNI
jgi:hypothetical protein